MPHRQHLFLLPLALALQFTARVGAAPPINPLHLTPHHITANVANIERATAWYVSVLGFEVRQRGQHGSIRFVELAVPGFGIALVQEPGTRSETAPREGGLPRWVHIVFAVPDPQAAFVHLKTKGAALRAREVLTGPVKSFLVTDSEGNEIEIVGDSLP